MTIEVTHYRGVHQGGTKEYSLYLIIGQRKDGTRSKALLVKRWGKVGAEGQIKIELCKTIGSAELNKALSERRSKGYDMNVEASTNHPKVEDALALYFSKSQQRSFWVNQLALLEPESFSADSRDPYDPMQSDRDKVRRVLEEAAREKAEEDARAQRRVEETELQSNPIFGMF